MSLWLWCVLMSTFLICERKQTDQVEFQMQKFIPFFDKMRNAKCRSVWIVNPFKFSIAANRGTELYQNKLRRSTKSFILIEICISCLKSIHFFFSLPVHMNGRSENRKRFVQLFNSNFIDFSFQRSIASHFLLLPLLLSIPYEWLSRSIRYLTSIEPKIDSQDRPGVLRWVIIILCSVIYFSTNFIWLMPKGIFKKRKKITRSVCWTMNVFGDWMRMEYVCTGSSI